MVEVSACVMALDYLSLMMRLVMLKMGLSVLFVKVLRTGLVALRHPSTSDSGIEARIPKMKIS